MDEELTIEAESPQPSRAPPDRGWWLKWIIARNPFYLLSAALLLFGINRLSIDPALIPGERDNLVFNFSALQVYELLLVVVAVFLARRAIWYDSTLLVVIENGLIFVPCVLITHAALFGRDVALPFSVLVAGAAIGRFALMRGGPVPLRRRLLLLGAAFLALNISLPFWYRSEMEAFAEDWLVPGRVCWLVLLPLLVACANLIETPHEWSSEPDRQNWLPLLITGLWAGATAIHLRSIDYISSLPFQVALLAPALWVACWTAYFRIHDFAIAPHETVRAVLRCAPAFVPLLAWRFEYFCLALACGNVLLFALAVARTRDRVSFHMMLFNLGIVVGCVAGEVLPRLAERFSPGHGVLAGVIFYVLARACLSRHPALGLAGALAFPLSFALLPGELPFFHLAVQGGAAFLIIHSYSWDQPMERGAVQLQTLAVCVWTLDSLVWTRTDPRAFWVVSCAALGVLAACGVARWMTGRWGARLAPAGAVVSLAAAPAYYLVDKIKTSPTGLVAVIGSFLLLGMGTVAALTRSSWNHSESRIDK